MLATMFKSLLLAQAASALVPIEQARLEVCLEQARTDPASAIAEAGTWLSDASGAATSYPRQCLGYAYALLLRWDAA